MEGVFGSRVEPCMLCKFGVLVSWNLNSSLQGCKVVDSLTWYGQKQGRTQLRPMTRVKFGDVHGSLVIGPFKWIGSLI